MTDVTVLWVVAASVAAIRAHVPIGADPRRASKDVELLDVLWIEPLWLTVLVLHGAYSRGRGETTAQQQRMLLSSTVIGLGLSGTVMYVMGIELYRSVFLLYFAVGYAVLALTRWLTGEVLAVLRRRGLCLHRAVLLGDERHLDEALRAFTRAPRLGYSFVGTVGGWPGKEHKGMRYLGETEDLRTVCLQEEVDTVVVVGAHGGADGLRAVTWTLQGTGVDVIVLPSLVDVAGPRVRLAADSGLAWVHLAEPQFERSTRLAKRTFDLVGVLVLLAVTVPLMAFATLSILRDDGRPVFYRQTRVGRNGREFQVLKFRTMVVGADRAEADLRADHQGAHWKLKRDPRVTRTGNWLRRWSVDELPQLVNVLRGEMSLVGPRPQQRHEVETYSATQARRLLVRPGMTGLWQVSGRSDLSLDEAIRLDLYYVENWSLTIDVWILLRTVRAVLARRGAY